MRKTFTLADIDRGINATIVRFAIRSIKQAGHICRRYFARGFSRGRGVEYKGDGSPVTQADREVEQYLRTVIGNAFPEHAIVGEEYQANAEARQAGGTSASASAPSGGSTLGGTSASASASAPSGGSTLGGASASASAPNEKMATSPTPTSASISAPAPDTFVWYIDPIDGTFSFIHGIPLYTCLLALYFNGEPLFGLIYNPELDDLVVAVRGGGCYFNGKRTTVSPCNTVHEGRMLCTELPILLRTAPKALQLVQNCYSMRTWCDAYGYVLLVTGRGDVVLDAGMKPWDVAPLYVIVREAGGVISDFSGDATGPLGPNAVATTSGIYQEVLRFLQKH